MNNRLLRITMILSAVALVGMAVAGTAAAQQVQIESPDEGVTVGQTQEFTVNVTNINEYNWTITGPSDNVRQQNDLDTRTEPFSAGLVDVNETGTYTLEVNDTSTPAGPAEYTNEVNATFALENVQVSNPTDPAIGDSPRIEGDVVDAAGDPISDGQVTVRRADGSVAADTGIVNGEFLVQPTLDDASTEWYLSDNDAGLAELYDLSVAADNSALDLETVGPNTRFANETYEFQLNTSDRYGDLPINLTDGNINNNQNLVGTPHINVTGPFEPENFDISAQNDVLGNASVDSNGEVAWVQVATNDTGFANFTAPPAGATVEAELQTNGVKGAPREGLEDSTGLQTLGQFDNTSDFVASESVAVGDPGPLNIALDTTTASVSEGSFNVEVTVTDSNGDEVDDSSKFKQVNVTAEGPGVEKEASAAKSDTPGDLPITFSANPNKGGEITVTAEAYATEGNPGQDELDASPVTASIQVRGDDFDSVTPSETTFGSS
jgi:hypothetical protein